MKNMFIDVIRGKKRVRKWVKFTALFLVSVAIGYGGLSALGSAGTVRESPANEELESMATANSIMLYSDDKLLTTMNEMTHQKVKAKEKWGAVEMSEGNILALISMINQGDYEHEEELMSILVKWEAGEFSDIVRDHNRIWNMQGGTIGEAYGKMSPEEEKEYVEKVFR